MKKSDGVFTGGQCFGRKTEKSGPEGLGKAGGVGVGIGCSVRWDGRGRPRIRGGLNKDWEEMRE